MSKKIDTRAIGLDIGLSFARWLTGKENLHYGYWDGLDVNAGNVGAAQEAYTKKLFSLLPEGKLRILDIGGGAGETAKKLLALGHSVEIVIPSAFLAGRCRENAPGAVVHETTFEDCLAQGPFDLCLFSESYQYVQLDVGLKKAFSLLTADGCVIIGDVFRTPEYYPQNDSTIVGGGHSILLFRELLTQLNAKVLFEEDITDHAAPSVDIEQGLFNVVGFGAERVRVDIEAAKPKVHWMLMKVWRLLTTGRSRERLDKRLNQTLRTADVFARNNRYLLLKLGR